MRVNLAQYACVALLQRRFRTLDCRKTNLEGENPDAVTDEELTGRVCELCKKYESHVFDMGDMGDLV